MDALHTNELIKALEHHVPEEETQLFPKVPLIWHSDKLRYLYRKMESFNAQWKKRETWSPKSRPQRTRMTT